MWEDISWKMVSTSALNKCILRLFVLKFTLCVVRGLPHSLFLEPISTKRCNLPGKQDCTHCAWCLISIVSAPSVYVTMTNWLSLTFRLSVAIGCSSLLKARANINTNIFNFVITWKAKFMKETLPNGKNCGWGAINTQKRFKSYRSKAHALIGQISVHCVYYCHWIAMHPSARYSWLVLNRGYYAVLLRNTNNSRAQTVSALVDFQEASFSISLTNTFQGLRI